TNLKAKECLDISLESKDFTQSYQLKNTHCQYKAKLSKTYSYKNNTSKEINPHSSDFHSFAFLQTYEVRDSNPYRIKEIFMQTSKTQELLASQTQDIYTNESAVLVTSKTQENALQNSIKNSLNSLESTHITYIPPHIDYVIFLDSDDYWEKKCIEECVRGFMKCKERGESVEVVCFDYMSFFDDGSPCEASTWDDAYGFTQETLITPKEWMQRTRYIFSLAWRALMDFKYLHSIKLEFLNGVIWEDTNFGTKLFAQATGMLMLRRKLYHYRVRVTSISGPKSHISPYLEVYLPYFNNNKTQLRIYNSASSWILLALDLLEFLENFHNIEIANGIKEKILPCYIKEALSIYRTAADPLNLRPKFSLLLPYLKNTNSTLRQRIIAFYPLLRPIVVKIHLFYLWQKEVGRKFWRWRKGRKNLKYDRAR
ncbi:glycosyltransferase family A protein, partial [Helicobacter equorum]|uniref:glycosyltransferase family A protein n=1 Tax=Helicobacter equorum TaxID=361872 RepID=UPI000CF01555